MQTRRKMIGALAALGLCGTMVAGFASRACAADAPKPKEADVQKMEAALPDKAYAKPEKARKVLIYGNANGFVHSSIPLGEVTIEKLGEKTGAWNGTVTNDAAAFDDLKNYDAVVLVSTTGHFLLPKAPEGRNVSEEQKKEYEQKVEPYKKAEKQRLQNLIDFVQKDGKGLAGIHAATDAYYDEHEYGELIGGYFNDHPWGSGDTVSVKIDDPKSPLTQSFGGQGFDIKDEIYQFSHTNKPSQTYSREKLHVLLSLDMSPGKTKPKPPRSNAPDNDYGVAWIKKAGNCRVFYCSLGHNEAVYANPAVVKFYLAGIQYALGDLQADASPSNAKPTASAK
jgi:uncharacterized protein